MAREISSDLFELIKSLSPVEKKHFRTFASAKKRNEESVIYLKIFNLIEKQDEYNETKILVKLKTVSPAYFSRIKNYLYDLILKNIEVFHDSDPPTYKIKKMINQIKILFVKGLTRQCEAAVQKAKSFAYEYEMYYFLIDILYYELILHQKKGYLKKNLEDILRIHKEQQEAVAHCANTMKYNELGTKINYVQCRIGVPRNKKQMKLYESVLQHPLMRDEKKASSLSSKIQFQNNQISYYSIMRDPHNAFKYVRRKTELLESKPFLIPYMILRYANSLRSELTYYIETKNLALFEANIKKLRELPEKHGGSSNEYLMASIFSSSSNAELLMYQALGEYKYLYSIINKIKDGLNRYEEKIDVSIIELYYNIARMYFGLEEYKETSKWLNKILNQHSRVVSDYMAFSKILRLIVYYELNDFDMLPYALKSVYRYLYKKERVYQFEQVLLTFIKKINESKNQVELFRKLKRELEVLQKDKYEKFPFSFFDMVSWLESKIEGKPYAEIIRKKSLAKKQYV